MRANGKKLHIGEAVRIIQDLRIPGTATGKNAIYVGRCFIHNGKRYLGPRNLPNVKAKFVLGDNSYIWEHECYWVSLRDAMLIESNLAVATEGCELEIQRRLEEELQKMLAEPRIEISGVIDSVRSFGKIVFVKLGDGWTIICKESVLGPEFMRKLKGKFHPGATVAASGPRIESNSSDKIICAVSLCGLDANGAQENENRNV